MAAHRRAVALVLVASTLLCAVHATAAVSARQLQQSITDFPPLCRCERNSTLSPWRLKYDLDASTPLFGYERHCFNIQKTDCDTKSPCCNATMGVYKVEFEIVPSCRDSFKRATVNGVFTSAFEFNAALGTFRVTRLNLTESSAPGTQICVLLKAGSSCTTLDKFCKAGGGNCRYSIFNMERTCCPVDFAGLPAPPPPSPPSPPFVPAFLRDQPPSPAPPPSPPRSEFPNCVCERNPLGSRMFVQPAVTTVPAGGNLTKLCFKVDVASTCAFTGKNNCCEFDLHKLEFEADPACYKALAYATIDGVVKPRLFQLAPYPVIKVSNIGKNWTAASAGTTEVCLALRPQCNTIQKLGAYHDGSITVAIANKPGSKPTTCCPLYQAR